MLSTQALTPEHQVRYNLGSLQVSFEAANNFVHPWEELSIARLH